ncbi:FAD/NAD(P)-binding protein [Actinomadura sp. 9N215]|uniref:FAD/NAD(P)-binding protein n=1 Tax=Actinomadura sp. 9N215 TaxID=3375150 RepID=UPI0037B7AF68
MELAIIGAGAAAVGLLDALDPAAATSVTVFDPAPEPWRGRPYQADLDSVLVNAPPAIMSIRFDDRDHYARWLDGGTVDYTDERLGHPIPPRAVYGGYLADTAEAALARFDRAEVIRTAVTAISLDERPTVHTADARLHTADRVVLCVGGGTPLDHYGLAGASGFVADPYPLERTLADVPPGRDVAVIGGGLTAVDIAVSLAARGHTGRITLASRSGTLPYVWQRPVETGVRHLTPDRLRSDGPTTLERLTALIRTELAEHGESLDDLAAWIAATARRRPAESLREQLGLVDDSHLGRRILQEAAHIAGPLAWRLLPAPDQERLRARHFRTITSLASPMVPRNAAVLLDLFDAGTLESPAGIEKIEAGDGGFRIIHGGGVRTADVVINAVNPPPHAIPRAAERLVSSLLGQGAAQHPDGGLVTDPGSGRIVVGGRPDPRLHVVGDLAGGGPFLVSGIPGVAAQAHRAARSVRR